MAWAVDEVDEVLRGIASEGGAAEAGVVGPEAVGVGMQVGEVAATAAGDEDLFAGLAGVIEHEDAAAAAGGGGGGHQPGGAGAEDDDVDLLHAGYMGSTYGGVTGWMNWCGWRWRHGRGVCAVFGVSGGGGGADGRGRRVCWVQRGECGLSGGGLRGGGGVVGDGVGRWGRVAELVVAGRGVVTPCGGCRQKLREFAGAEAVVRMVDEAGVEVMRISLGELLPHAFGPENLA